MYKYTLKFQNFKTYITCVVLSHPSYKSYIPANIHTRMYKTSSNPYSHTPRMYITILNLESKKKHYVYITNPSQKYPIYPNKYHITPFTNWQNTESFNSYIIPEAYFTTSPIHRKYAKTKNKKQLSKPNTETPLLLPTNNKILQKKSS